MELKEFIKETLVQVFEGVKESQAGISNIGGSINPTVNLSLGGGGNKKGIDIDFEIALAQSSDSTNKKGIGVMLSIVAGGAGSEDKNKVESMTKIKFSVPVYLP